MPSRPFEQVLTGSALARRCFGACEWNNRIIISGGLSSAGATLNDVWESYDGITWKQLVTGSNSFSVRSSHQMLVFNNCLYVIGGYSGSGYRSDVWMSRDGSNWSQVKAIGFTARDDHNAFVLDNKLFVVGGDAGGLPFTDVWSTPNGTTWTRVVNGNGNLRRTVAMCAVFNNRAHVIAGYNGSARLSTSVISDEGYNWSLSGSSCGLPAFDDGAAEVFDGKIVVTGGFNGAAMDNLYYSQDGEKYVVGSANIGFRVYQHQMVALKEPNRLFLLFGRTTNTLGGAAAVRNDVWMSTGNFQSRY